MKHKIALASLIAFLGIVGGCGAARPSTYYQLTVPGQKIPAVDPTPYPVTLLVGSITTSHLYQDDQIVYTSNGAAMGRYQYLKWAEPPSEMIADVLLRKLRQSGRYEHIYPVRSDARGDYILRGHLYDLREIDGNVIAARVTFDFELRDTKTATTLWTYSYSHDEPVDGKDVAAVIAAIDRNVQSGLSGAAAGLDEYFAGNPAIALTTGH